MHINKWKHEKEKESKTKENKIIDKEFNAREGVFLLIESMLADRRSLVELDKLLREKSLYR